MTQHQLQKKIRQLILLWLERNFHGANGCLFVNGTKNIKFKAKNSKTVALPLCLGKILEDFSADDMKKTGLVEYTCYFSVDYDAPAVDDILNIHKYLIKENDIVLIFFFIKICFNA